MRHLGSWQYFTADDLDRDDKPYFDNPSIDGGNRNVGCFPTGTGGVCPADYAGVKSAGLLTYNFTNHFLRETGYPSSLVYIYLSMYQKLGKKNLFENR